MVVNSLSRNGLLFTPVFFLLFFSQQKSLNLSDLDFKIENDKILWAQLNLTAAIRPAPFSSLPAGKKKIIHCSVIPCLSAQIYICQSPSPFTGPEYVPAPQQINGFNLLNSRGEPHKRLLLAIFISNMQKSHKSHSPLCLQEPPTPTPAPQLCCI